MKNLINSTIVFSFFLLFSSCNKKVTLKQKYYGYIYNSIDSTPFENTQFKVYRYTKGGYGLKQETKEEYFYTNDKGYFDITSTVLGELVWPSYFDGAAYLGPKDFGNPISCDNSEAGFGKCNFDTIYTIPYH